MTTETSGDVAIPAEDIRAGVRGEERKFENRNQKGENHGWTRIYTDGKGRGSGMGHGLGII